MATIGSLQRLLAVRNLAIDRLAAEIAADFAAAGIESVVLKGPVLAAWLYPDEVRPYGDADLLVPPECWDDAVAVLVGLGFADRLGPMAHPRMESFASTAFIRGDRDEDNLDLHCAIHGLEADPDRIWSGFSAGSASQQIGGAELRVPGRPALALHVALHAAHHTEPKPLEDLRRALDVADDALWAEAWELAGELDGGPAFASGLRRLPAGEELARRLGIGAEVRSGRHDVRHQRVPTAEGIDGLLAPGQGFGERARTVAGELFPRPEFMRWWSPLARRGPIGLALSYPWRWLWLAWNAPRGLLAVRRARRRGS
jgi:putative nucleotidyltransferase-like protein